MGDVVYLFNVIQKPLISEHFNTYNIATGYISEDIIYSGTKEHIGYYLLFTFLNIIVQKFILFFNFNYIPPYLITTWLANLLFYFFSANFIILIIKRHKLIHTNLKYFIILWLGIYIGSYYYNITYPFIVVTMAVLNMGYLIFELSDYFNDFTQTGLIRVLILTISLFSYGATGAMYMAISSFAIVSITLLSKHKQAFIQIPVLLLPIISYLYGQELFQNVFIYLIFLFFFVLILSALAFYKKKVSIILFKIFPFLFALLFVFIIIYSFYNYPNYIENWSLFFKYQGQYDRTQDYFTLTSLDLILQNIPHYVFIIALFINQKTRRVGSFLGIMALFFINPFVREFAIAFVSRVDVYNRIFFLIFNIGTIGLGIVSLSMFKIKSVHVGEYILVIVTMMILPQTYQQVTGYAYPTYEPTEDDYNPLYKISNNQIEILEKMRQIIVIEEIDNPLIISQIWSTAYYAPEFVTLGYNVNQQRNGPNYIGEELYKIFYTPAIPGDFGPTLNRSEVIQTCNLLIERKIDFVIYDKRSQLYDDEIGDYMATEWYIRDCADKIIENDRYSLYRFYWR